MLDADSIMMSLSSKLVEVDDNNDREDDDRLIGQ